MLSSILPDGVEEVRERREVLASEREKVLSSHLFMYLSVYFEMGSHSVTQAGVQWHDHSSLQP